MEHFKKIVYTIDELGEILPIGRNKLYELVNQEGFPRLKISKKILIPVEGFDKWFKEQTIYK